jgi:hypothetical protein
MAHAEYRRKTLPACLRTPLGLSMPPGLKFGKEGCLRALGRE